MPHRHIHSQGKCTGSPRTCGHLSARRIYIETVHCKPNNDRVAKCEVQGRGDAGERKEEEALQADVHNVWRNAGPKWEYRCGNGNEKMPRRTAPHTARTFYLPLFSRACMINFTYHFPRATVCSIFQTLSQRACFISLHRTSFNNDRNE